MSIDEIMIREALAVAELAGQNGEVPIGAVLVDGDGNILAKAANRTETDRSAVAHAELLAIAEGCKQRKSRRLLDCTIYTTLEPCPMCAGAIASARIGRVVFGAKDPRAGAYGSLIDLSVLPLESKPQVTSGVLAEECLEPIRRFFQERRKQSK
ncbi:MAG: nucleoside deaminase [Ruminococcaceae bacterium]|nr:nucleoside deaminase [Oscillospiraceae bacterium]